MLTKAEKGKPKTYIRVGKILTIKLKFMKASKIAIGVSAFVLAIGGFLATKANKKAALTRVYIKMNPSFGGAATLTAVSSHWTNVKSANSATVILQTVGGAQQIGTAYTSSVANNKAYFK